MGMHANQRLQDINPINLNAGAFVSRCTAHKDAYVVVVVVVVVVAAAAAVVVVVVVVVAVVVSR